MGLFSGKSLQFSWPPPLGCFGLFHFLGHFLIRWLPYIDPLKIDELLQFSSISMPSWLCNNWTNLLYWKGGKRLWYLFCNSQKDTQKHILLWSQNLLVEVLLHCNFCNAVNSYYNNSCDCLVWEVDQLANQCSESHTYCLAPHKKVYVLFVYEVSCGSNFFCWCVHVCVYLLRNSKLKLMR